MALLPRTAALLTTVTQCRGLSQRAGARYLLVDGHNLIYRAFYAMPQLSRSGDRPVGAVMGVANTFLKLALPYSHVVFCLDPKGPGWREELRGYVENSASVAWKQTQCASYKETRPKMPPELRPQVADAAAVARAFSAAVVCVDGYEADDVIATLAAKHRGEGVDVLTCVEIKIYGADRRQGLTAARGVRRRAHLGPAGGPGRRGEEVRRPAGPHRRLPRARRRRVGQRRGRPRLRAQVRGRVQCANQILRSDVPRIDVPQVALIEAFGDLDAILAGAPDSDAVPKRARAAIAACDGEALRRDRRLVTLREDVPLPPLAFDPFAWDNVLAMADRFEFTTFRRRAEALMREQHEE